MCYFVSEATNLFKHIESEVYFVVCHTSQHLTMSMKILLLFLLIAAQEFRVDLITCIFQTGRAARLTRDAENF